MKTPLPLTHESPVDLEKGHQNKIAWKTLGHKSFLYFCSQVAAKGFFFLSMVYLARKLGADLYGKFAFGFALVTVCSVLTKFGIDLLISRDVAENKQRTKGHLASGLFVRLILSVVFLILIYAILHIMKKPPDVSRLVLLLAFAIIFQSFAGTFTALFEAYQFFGYRSFLNVLLYSSLFITVVIAFHWKIDLLAVGLSFFGVSLFYLLIATALCYWKITRFSTQIDSKATWSFFLAAFPLGLSDLFISIYYRFDTVLLSWFQDDRIVGWYDAAYSFVYGLRLLPNTVVIVLLPALSSMFQKDKDEAVSIYRAISKYSLSLGLLLTLLVATNSTKLVHLLYGSDYLPASSVLPLLAWTCSLMFVGGFQGMFLIVLERRKALLTATSIGAFSNVLLNLLLIPKWSMMGAAIATLASELLVFFVCFRNLSDVQPLSRFMKDSAGAVIATILSGILWFFLRQVHLALQIGIILIFYCFVLLLFSKKNKIYGFAQS